MLRQRLHDMTLARNALESKLAQESTEVASLESRVSGLQSDLQQRTAERDAARAEAATLQAKLAAVPTPLEAAEQYVQRVVWAAEATDLARPKGEIVSLAALQYVADNHVSLWMRAYDLNHGGLPTLDTANDIFSAQAGLCGNAAIAFAKLVRSFGYQVQSADFYYEDPVGTPNGHTAAEVFYDGSWHYFDPTFGLFWRDASGNVLDIDTVRTTGGTEHKNDDLLFNVIEDRATLLVREATVGSRPTRPR